MAILFSHLQNKEHKMFISGTTYLCSHVDKSFETFYCQHEEFNSCVNTLCGCSSYEKDVINYGGFPIVICFDAISNYGKDKIKAIPLGAEGVNWFCSRLCRHEVVGSCVIASSGLYKGEPNNIVSLSEDRLYDHIYRQLFLYQCGVGGPSIPTLIR